MTKFSREFPVDHLTDPVLEENSWFTNLLLRWHPAGDAVKSRLGVPEGVFARDHVNTGEFQHLRVAFRGRYMNFYCGGQSIAKVDFDRDRLQAKIHEKYVYGYEDTGSDYITLTSKGFLELGTGRPDPCNSLQQWISNANSKIGLEKRFVDLVVAHNPDVIDVEMGLPAFSEVPKERRAPRIDLVSLEPHEGRWRVVLWEVKLVGDGRARCRGNDLPKVVEEQLQPYADWLSDRDRAKSVADAYRHNCRLLVGLHRIAKRLRPDIEDLGPGIQAVAHPDAIPLSVDNNPRLLVIYDEKDEAFRKHRHYDKLVDNGWHVKLVESLNEVALCGLV